MTSIVVVSRLAGASTLALADLTSSIKAAVERGLANGAHFIAILADGVAFSFDVSSLQDALDLALQFARNEDTSVSGWKTAISYGELEAVRHIDALVTLSIGPALASAEALSQVAQVGEVVLDAEARAVTTEDLSIMKRRLAHDGLKRLRGYVLNTAEPWRKNLRNVVSKLVRSPFVARAHLLEQVLEAEAGATFVVRGQAGHGGSRFLEEIHLASRRSLCFLPSSSGAEPFAAIKQLFAVRSQRHGGDVTLEVRHQDVQRTVLDGQSFDVDKVILSLLNMFRSAESSRGGCFLLIDDATQLDESSLALIRSMREQMPSLVLVIRLDESEEIPASLFEGSPTAQLKLTDLEASEAQLLITHYVADALQPEAARRYARLSSYSPLGALFALRMALLQGELQLREGQWIARDKAAGRGRALSARGWIAKVLASLNVDAPSDAHLLALIGVAGMSVDVRVIDDAVNALEMSFQSSRDHALHRLGQEGFLTVHGGMYQLTSRSVRDAVIEGLSHEQKVQFHNALADAYERQSRGFARCNGAFHASFAGRRSDAARMYLEVSDWASAQGLQHEANELRSLARQQDPTQVPLDERDAKAGPSVGLDFSSGEAILLSRTLDEQLAAVLDPNLSRRPNRSSSIPPRDQTIPAPPLGEQSEHTTEVPISELQETSQPNIIFPRPTSDNPEVTSNDALLLSPDNSQIQPNPLHFEAVKHPQQTIRMLYRDARRAFLDRDGEEGIALLRELEELGEKPKAANRLRALWLMHQGQVDAGIALLSKEARSTIQANAVLRDELVRAIALGVQGKKDEAVFTALCALFRARQLAHPVAVLACEKLVEWLIVGPVLAVSDEAQTTSEPMFGDEPT